MRRALSTVLTIIVLAGTFLGTWKLTSGGQEGPGEGNTGPAGGNVTTVPGTGDGGSAATTPGTGAPGGNGTGGGNGTVTRPTTPARLTKPANQSDMVRAVATYLAGKGINQLAAGRILAYSIAASHDTERRATDEAWISPAGGGMSKEMAMSAAARVAAEVAGLPEMKKDVAGWAEAPSAAAEKVIADVVARAKADGYDEAAASTPDTFTGPSGFTATGSTYPKGLEPGWGNLRPILLDPQDCQVPAVDRQALAKEIAALKLDATESAAAPEASIHFTSPVLPPILAQAASLFLSQGETATSLDFETARGIALLIVLNHDASILAWKAKWSNGVASPVAVARQGKPVEGGQFAPAPSYPSWPASLVSLTETFHQQVFGKPLPWKQDAKLDQFEIFSNTEKDSGKRIHHWAQDVEAGRRLGACVAERGASVMGR